MEISFYSGNFLGLAPESVVALLTEATRFVTAGHAHGIRFSTRPDAITSKTLQLIAPFPVRTVEIGAQSMDDRVLTMSQRGHTALDTENAMRLLRKTPYAIGMQMMTGLPGDDRLSTHTTAEKIAALSPDFVRIYPAVVLENSLLARWYAQGRYQPLTIAAAVDRVKDAYLLFRKKDIRVVRMGLQASDVLDGGSVLAGPYHPAFGHLVLSSIWLDKASALLTGKETAGATARFRLNPVNVSRLRGQKNQNIKTLMQTFHLQAIDVIQDETLPDDALHLICGRS